MAKDTAHACFCETCKLESKISKIVEGKSPDDYIPVLAKLAGDALATYELPERDEQAQRFIRFMQKRAIQKARELRGEGSVPPEVKTMVDEVVDALRKAGFNIAEAKVIKL